MQAWLAPQSLAIRQTGAASPGVTQKPVWQTLAPLAQLQQSVSLAQPVRQAPLTHICPAPQSTFARQAGVGA